MNPFSRFVYIFVLASASLSINAQQERPLSNADIVHMIQAGLGESVIAQKISSSNAAFTLDIDSLIALKKANVSDVVLKAMLLAKDRASQSSQPAPNVEPPNEMSRLRRYLEIPDDYSIARATSSQIKTTAPLRVFINAGSDIHVIDSIRAFASAWNFAWESVGRRLEIVSSWQEADMIVSHYAVTEELKRLSETRTEVRTDVRVVSRSTSDYGAMYAGIALRDPWLAIAGAIPKPTQALVPDVHGQTTTESFDVLPVIVYLLKKTGPKQFDLLGRHVYTSKNGKELGRQLWTLIQDSLPHPKGLFVNSKNDVIASEVESINSLEELSGQLCIPFIVESGPPPLRSGDLLFSYDKNGLRIQNAVGKVLYEGYGSIKERIFFDYGNTRSYFVVLFQQRASKNSKGSVGGYYSIPRQGLMMTK